MKINEHVFCNKAKKEGNHLIIRHTFILNRVLKIVNDLPIVKVVQLLNRCLGILFTLDSQGNTILNLVKSHNVNIHCHEKDRFLRPNHVINIAASLVK